ncbi:MAG: hypothetical protein ACTSRZ_17355 [Promethearchaeota archaeon]
MRNIIFSKDIKNISLDIKGKTVCIYEKRYKKMLPQLKNTNFIEFSYLKNNYKNQNFFKDINNIVFIGLNKIFNLSSRIDPIFDILQYNLSNIQIFSIDTSPYIGDIWRIWTHFSFTRNDFGGYTYSYLLQTDYNKYLKGLSNKNPVSIEKIKEYAKNKVEIEYEIYFRTPQISIFKLPSTIHQKYQLLKKELFDKYNRIGPIIKDLSNFAKNCYKKRNIPQEHKIFDFPDDIKILRTDLKIDEYLTNKLIKKINEVNSVVKALREIQ